MNTPSGQFLPKWFWIIIGLQIIIVSVFALSTLFNPPPDFNYTTMAYITRNLTAVLAVILAVWLRSHAALFVALAARVVTDIVDATTVFTMNATYLKSAVPMVVALLIIPALVGMVFLWRRIKQEKRRS
ncbi:hypothetical protein [Roseovarius albus]|uniref:hypothetical protein n=1 Tax=Roseovarius albus TaxID=1247867 RepID=UPI00117AAEE0|nr:hypothetical protein [Roseovarius albus]